MRKSSRRPSSLWLALYLPAILVGLGVGEGAIAGTGTVAGGWTTAGPGLDVGLGSPGSASPGITRAAMHWPGSSPSHAIQVEGFAEAPVVFGQSTPTPGPATTVDTRVDPRGLARSSVGIEAADTAARIARDRLLRAGRTGAPATAPPHAPL